MIKIGPRLRKWTLLDEMQAQCIEADEDLDHVTDHVLGADLEDDLGSVDWSGEWTSYPEEVGLPQFPVPWEEFRAVLFFLPKLEDLPIFTAAWKSAGEPSEFLLRCFSGAESQVGDEFWVDTQGYDYPRYKALVRRVT